MVVNLHPIYIDLYDCGSSAKNQIVELRLAVHDSHKHYIWGLVQDLLRDRKRLDGKPRGVADPAGYLVDRVKRA